jgi:hypothetical protein
MATRPPGLSSAFTTAGSTPQFARMPLAAKADDYALAIIDGTGVWNDDEYDASMAHSFCSQLWKKPPVNGQVMRWRGPWTDGMSTGSKGLAAMKWLVDRKAAGTKRLFIAGYSRGATAAVVAAQNLAFKDIDVDGLFLFDPVDRSLAMTFGIPKKVAFSRTAIRCPTKAMIDKYEDSIGWGENPMRPSFGNLDVTAKGQGDHIVNNTDFPGSHGALGGVGWSHVKEDPACQEAVAGFMNKGFGKLGLPYQIASISTPNDPPKKEVENKPAFKKFEMPKFERGPKY